MAPLAFAVAAAAPLFAAGWAVGARYYYLPAVGLCWAVAEAVEEFGFGLAARVTLAAVLLALGAGQAAERRQEVVSYDRRVAAARRAVAAGLAAGHHVFHVDGGIKDFDLAVKEDPALEAGGVLVLGDVPASFALVPPGVGGRRGDAGGGAAAAAQRRLPFRRCAGRRAGPPRRRAGPRRDAVACSRPAFHQAEVDPGRSGHRPRHDRGDQATTRRRRWRRARLTGSVEPPVLQCPCRARPAWSRVEDDSVMQWPVVELAEWEELRQCPGCNRFWLAAWPEEVEGGMILCSLEPASARRLKEIDRPATLRAYCLARLEEHLGPLRERKMECRKAGCGRKRLERSNYCIEHLIADRFGRHLARLDRDVDFARSPPGDRLPLRHAGKVAASSMLSSPTWQVGVERSPIPSCRQRRALGL